MGTFLSLMTNGEDRSLELAKEFFESQKYIDLVKEAKSKNITIRSFNKTTIIERTTSTYIGYSETEWLWDKPDSGDLVYDILKRRLDLCSTDIVL